jgi:hypothetical protein
LIAQRKSEALILMTRREFKMLLGKIYTNGFGTYGGKMRRLFTSMYDKCVRNSRSLFNPVMQTDVGLASAADHPKR